MSDRVLTLNNIGKLPVRSSAEPTWINGIVFGPPGIGKTTFLGSAADVEQMSPVLFLDTEQGTMSLTGVYNVDVVDIRSWADFQDVLNEFNAGKLPYKTIVVDSITEMATIGLEEIVQRSIQASKLAGKLHDPDQPELQDWGRNQTRVHKLIRYFKALECNVFFTALEFLDAARPSKPMMMPSLNTKRLVGELPGKVDEVWYFYKKDREDGTTDRILLTDEIERVMAKDRSRTLPQTIANPTMQIIYDFYSGKITKDNYNG
ncbi:MAG: ATP-binding protein [Chitinophagaceae bacterium]